MCVLPGTVEETGEELDSPFPGSLRKTEQAALEIALLECVMVSH